MDSTLARLDDSSLLVYAGLMRDTFLGIAPSTCTAFAADPERSFPFMELDSTLSQRWADMTGEGILARVRGRAIQTQMASDSALHAALLGGAWTATPTDSQRLRRAYERRSATSDEYCWYARVAWARLASLPAAEAAPLVRRMFVLTFH